MMLSSCGRRRAVRGCCSAKISSSAAITVSTCARSRMYGGRKRSTVSLVQLMTICFFSISVTACLANLGRIELDGQHQAHAAHICDAVVPFGEPTQLLLEIIADFGHVRHQVFVFYAIHRRPWPRRRPAARRRMWCRASRHGTRAPPLRCRALAPMGTPPARGLARVVMSGFNAVVLIGAPLAGAAQPA